MLGTIAAMWTLASRLSDAHEAGDGGIQMAHVTMAKAWTTRMGREVRTVATQGSKAVRHAPPWVRMTHRARSTHSQCRWSRWVVNCLVGTASS